MLSFWVCEIKILYFALLVYNFVLILESKGIFNETLYRDFGVRYERA